MFAHGLKAKRIYTERNTPLRFNPEELSLSKPMLLDTKRRRIQAKVKKQPTPIKDFINFKKMGGNEILLNLENNENLASTELTSGLLELAKRDREGEHDWNKHQISYKCIKDLKSRMGYLNVKNVI